LAVTTRRSFVTLARVTGWLVLLLALAPRAGQAVFLVRTFDLPMRGDPA
jgi:hypothetical protein